MSTQPSPLDQLEQQQAPQQSPAANNSSSNISPLEQLEQQQAPASATPQTGEVTNDVGNTVIVPKDGESFTDTVNRAITHQKSMTPQQQQTAIDAEMKTAPKKAAETLAASAGIGIGGPAALAALGEGGSALYELAVNHLAGSVLPGMEGVAARAKLLEMAPKVLEAATKLGIGTAGIHYLWKAALGGK
jgi:hypothetical protein